MSAMYLCLTLRSAEAVAAAVTRQMSACQRLACPSSDAWFPCLSSSSSVLSPPLQVRFSTLTLLLLVFWQGSLWHGRSLTCEETIKVHVPPGIKLLHQQGGSASVNDYKADQQQAHISYGKDQMGRNQLASCLNDPSCSAHM